MLKGYHVIAFENTHLAISAQRSLKDKLPFAVMPVPRAVSAGCGIAIRLDPENSAQAMKLLKTDGIEGVLHHCSEEG